MEYRDYDGLKGGRGIATSKGHYQVFVEPISCPNVDFPLITFSQLEEVEAIFEVKLDKDLSFF